MDTAWQDCLVDLLKALAGDEHRRVYNFGFWQA